MSILKSAMTLVFCVLMTGCFADGGMESPDPDVATAEGELWNTATCYNYANAAYGRAISSCYCGAYCRDFQCESYAADGLQQNLEFCDGYSRP
jgi:hypothetical protein